MQMNLPTLSETQSNIAFWRAENPALNLLLDQQVAPAKALRHFGLTLWNGGQAEFAARVFTAAVVLAPEEAALWGDLAGALQAGARPTQARACMEISLSKQPEQPRAWLFLATLHNAAEDYVAAEQAFLKALELDSGLADACFGLGIIRFQQRRHKEAAEHLLAAVRHGSDNYLVQFCLGQVLYLQGDFSGAASAFASAQRHQPGDPQTLRKLGLLRLMEILDGGGTVDEALAVYRDIAGSAAEDIAGVTKTAFSLLSGYGHRSAAIKLVRARLELVPDDLGQRYMLAALSGEHLERAPEAYVIEHFNHFAEGFDKQLVEVLNYHVPEELSSLVTATGRTFNRALDLGCGTGLAGSLLRPFAKTLIGVDLAPRMLEKAAERGRVYDELVEAEAVSFLAREPKAFDLIIAADLLIYIGNLTELMAMSAQSLQAGGLFALSIETTDVADYALLPSGRFAHRIAYIEKLSQRDFIPLEAANATIRLEASRPVAGFLFVLQRR
jgi:predicted TPR repeat methyltransferase/Flp pilus assembly protein TadD